jgi:hypothetical protein
LTRLSNSAAAKCGKAAAVPTSASVQPNSISTTRSPAQGDDNQRRADIDQKLYAAAHVPGIDLHPAGAHLAQLQQHCRAFFLGHGARIPESWWRPRRTPQSAPHDGRFPVHPYLSVNRLGLRRF